MVRTDRAYDFPAGPTRSIFVGNRHNGLLNVDTPAFHAHMPIGDNVTVVSLPQRAAWAVVDQGEANR